MIIAATSIVLGKIFSVLSGPSILNNCIPPTFKRGKIVIAITTIPIPPNHCIIALHNKILFGVLSRLVITVAPVVVIPDMLSKNASLIENGSGDNKKGKLPFKTKSITYDLEYGTDSLEIHIDSAAKSDRIVLIDDLLATGGTLAAAAKLIESLGATVVELGVIIELVELDGRNKLNQLPVHSLCQM